MIERVLKTKLLEMIAKYPIVTITGPRQSGKSILLAILNCVQDDRTATKSVRFGK